MRENLCSIQEAKEDVRQRGRHRKKTMERESATHERKEKVGSMDSFRQRQLFLFFFCRCCIAALSVLLQIIVIRSSKRNATKRQKRKESAECALNK